MCRPTLTKSTSLLNSFLSQSWFPPASDPNSFTRWRNSNVYRFKDVVTEGKLLSKQQLEQKFNIDIPWFQYIQMSAMVSKMLANNSLNLELTPFERLMDVKQDYVVGLTSLIYKLLNSEVWSKPSAFENAWIRDCGGRFSNTNWPRVWVSTLCCSRSTYIKSQQYKLVARWYLTPYRLSLIHSGSSAICWKGIVGGSVRVWHISGVWFYIKLLKLLLWLCRLILWCVFWRFGKIRPFLYQPEN